MYLCIYVFLYFCISVFLYFCISVFPYFCISVSLYFVLQQRTGQPSGGGGECAAGSELIKWPNWREVTAPQFMTPLLLLQTG